MTSKYAGRSFTCTECGALESNDWIPEAAERLWKSKECHHCNFWLRQVRRSDDPSSVRVDGIHYRICEEPTEKRRKVTRLGLGFGGSKCVIRFDDGREVISHNLWCQGDIPEAFRGRLPDNAIFVVPQATNK